MASRKRKAAPPPPPRERDLVGWIATLETSAPLGGVPGPGRWLIAEYQPTALFSLKVSLATSSVGKSLVVPTPYAIKMALIDAAFRARFSDSECASLLLALIPLDVRVNPGPSAVVTHTFLKVRQESRGSDPLRPYSSTISYREVVHHQGPWLWAFDLASVELATAEKVITLLPHIRYVGKRGSFIQFLGFQRVLEVGVEFTQPVMRSGAWSPPTRGHITPLDDFGPEAELAVLSSFSAKPARRDRHRKFVETIVPLGIVNSGPGFTEYARD